MSQADGVNSSHQKSLGIEHRQIIAETIAAPEVDLDCAPPIGGLAENNIGEFELPGLLLLPGKKLSQPVILAQHLLGLETKQFQALVFAAQGLILPKQFPARRHDICGFARQLFGRVGQAEERQKEAANAQLEPGSGTAWQIKKNKRQKHNQTQSNVMRTFQHLYTDPGKRHHVNGKQSLLTDHRYSITGYAMR